MNAKKANYLFLTIILLTFAVIALINVIYRFTGYVPSLVMNNFISEMSGFLPAVAFVLISGDRFSSVVPFKKLRLPTILLIPLFVILIFPGIVLFNAISLLFVPNTVLSASDQLMSLPFWEMVLSIGIFGPFIEEFIFRGVLFQSYKRSGRILGAAILSAVTFGLMHLNINQAAYAFFFGLLFAVLFEATGSILATFLAHGIFNTAEVCMMYMSERMNSGSLATAQEMLNGESGRAQLLSVIGTLVFPAVLCTGLAILVMYLMSNLEGRKEEFVKLVEKREEGPAEPLVTAPLIVAIILCAVYMVYYTVMTAAMSG